MGFEAQLQALADDAAVWDRVATTLSGASSSAAGRALHVAELSWAGEVTGLVSTYESIRAKVERLLKEGSTETGTISDGLITVKQTYEGTDAAAQAELQSAWRPKE
ncbi:MAG: hypothetical protein ACRCSN_17110 [Dermatophilaceae bacterium]